MTLISMLQVIYLIAQSSPIYGLHMECKVNFRGGAIAYKVNGKMQQDVNLSGAT